MEKKTRNMIKLNSNITNTVSVISLLYALLTKAIDHLNNPKT